MAAEAFDPFANDDEDGGGPPTVSVVKINPISPPRNSTRRSSSSSAGQSSAPSDVDIIKEFCTALQLNDDGVPLQSAYPINFDGSSAHNVEDTSRHKIDVHKHNNGSELQGVDIIMYEEMSVMHKSGTNQCSVKVRGSVSVSCAYIYRYICVLSSIIEMHISYIFLHLISLTINL